VALVVSKRFHDFFLRFRAKICKKSRQTRRREYFHSNYDNQSSQKLKINKLERVFTFGNLCQCAVDAHGGFGSQQDGVVGLTHNAAQDALEISGTVTESDKDHGLS
jgi:hypothetical protein